MEYPRLIEQNVKNYINNNLYKCHQYKTEIFQWVFNIGLFILFLLILFLILFLRKKRKLTPQEMINKQMTEQQHILSKIKQYQMNKKSENASNITNLPFHYNPEMTMNVI